MLRHLFRFSPFLLVLVLCSCATQSLQLNTESGQPTVVRIPPLYIQRHINPQYVKFLERVFPEGVPNKAVTTDRQHFLYRYCVVLFEQRDFAKTIECLDSVQKSTDVNGDPELIIRTFSEYALTERYEFNSPGGEFPLTVREPWLRALVMLELGNFRQSAQYAERSVQRFNDVEKRYWIGKPKRVMAEITEVKDEFAPRLTLLPDQDAEIKSLSNLAVIYWLSGDSEGSNKVIAQLHTRLDPWAARGNDWYSTREGVGALVRAYLMTRGNKVYSTGVRAALVRAYMTQGQYKKALEIADDSRHLGADLLLLGAGAVGAPFTFGLTAIVGVVAIFLDQNTVATTFQVSHAQVEVGRYTDAKVGLDDILGKEEMKALAGIYWAALYDRGRIAEHEANLDEAVTYYRTAVDEIERQRSSINTESGKIGFFGDKQAVYQALVRVLFETGKFEDAFLTGERSKSRALVDMLAKMQGFRIAAQDTEKINQLLSRSQIGEVSLARNTAADTELSTTLNQRSVFSEADAVAMLNEVRNMKAAAREQLATQSPELASLVSVTQVPLFELQQALPAGETLVSYYDDTQNLYAFLIDRAELQAVKLERGKLEEDIQILRKAIQQRDNTHQAGATALYARLIEPLQSKIRTGKLIIAGHGALHYLPFAALSDGQRFLVDRYQLSFLPSASTLKFVGKIKADDKLGTLLAFGNPDLGDRQYDLPFGEQEAKGVAGLFEHSSVFLGKEASKKNLQAYGAGFRYLHFATHGKFYADEPLDSALMLASNSVTNSQDRLTVGDLYSMRFDADLVALSACETGLGKVANGDDVVGLVRGFLFAGTNQVVSTQWEIADEVTSILMIDFYEKIKAGTGKAESLRESQLAIRKQYPHPYFWAAFQITSGAGK